MMEILKSEGREVVEFSGILDFKSLPLGVTVTASGTGCECNGGAAITNGALSDVIAEALMKNVIRNLRAAIQNPQDHTARSNLMRYAVMAENLIIKRRRNFARSVGAFP